MSQYGMTSHQKKVLDFVRAYIATNGIAPSYAEIQKHMAMKSKSGVHRIIHALKERGMIDFMKNRNRSIVLLLPDGTRLEKPPTAIFKGTALDDIKLGQPVQIFRDDRGQVYVRNAEGKAA